MAKKPINETHELINKVTGFKAAITSGKVENGQNFYGVLANLKKNLQRSVFSDRVARSRGVLLQESNLRRLLTAQGAGIEDMQQRIREILEECRNYLNPMHHA